MCRPQSLRQIAQGKRYPSAGGPVTRRSPRRCDDLSCLRFLRQGLGLTPGEVDRWVSIALDKAERDHKSEARERFEAGIFDQLDNGETTTVVVDRNQFRDVFECKNQGEVREREREVAGCWGLRVSVTAEDLKFQLVNQDSG